MAATKNAHTKWAERKDKIYFIVEIQDAKDVEVKFEDKKLNFKGIGAFSSGESPFDQSINFSKEINPTESSFKVTPREIYIQVIKKEEEDSYWESLTEEPLKTYKSWLTVDWDKWVDEDEEADAGEEFGGGMPPGMDMGGMGGMGGMPGMGGMGGMPGGMGGMPGMGGAGGMGGMDMEAMMKQMGGMGGMGGMPGMPGDEGDSDDDEGADLDDLDAAPKEEAKE